MWSDRSGMGMGHLMVTRRTQATCRAFELSLHTWYLGQDYEAVSHNHGMDRQVCIKAVLLSPDKQHTHISLVLDGRSRRVASSRTSAMHSLSISGIEQGKTNLACYREKSRLCAMHLATSLSLSLFANTAITRRKKELTWINSSWSKSIATPILSALVCQSSPATHGSWTSNMRQRIHLFLNGLDSFSSPRTCMCLAGIRGLVSVGAGLVSPRDGRNQRKGIVNVWMQHGG